MAISFIGSATGTNTATMPAHVAGDLIVVAAFRFGTTTPATPPGGWTTPVNAGTGTAPNAIARTVGLRFAVSSSEVVGTWTNADLLVVHVYRGAAGIGNFTTGATATSTSIAYANLTLQNNVTSWVAFFGGVVSTTSTVETPPTGLTLRQNNTGATGEIASFDTNGPFTGDWAAVSAPLGVSAYRTAPGIELLESPRALTAVPGSYAVSGADTPVIRPSPISFIGAATGTNTATLPAHQAGDLILVAAFNTAAATFPGVISGYTNVASGNPSAPARAVRAQWKIATSSSETIPTISNCTICAVAVYRGVRQVLDASTGAAQTSTSSTNISYAGLTLAKTDGSSWVATAGLTLSTTSTIENPPAGSTMRANAVDATSEIVLSDTNGGTTVWASKSVALGVTSNSIAVSVEIRAPVNTNISPDPGSYAISGANTALARAYTITADPGSYMLSGADTPFIRSLLISAAPGAYALSGANTTLDTARYIIAEAGSYAISGANTALVRSLLISANPGSYTISGAATGVLRSLIMSPAPGSYALSGANTTLEKGYVIFADPGSYSINGADTPLIRALEIVAAPGAYVLGGADTAIYAGRVVNAEPGSYVINGSDVTFELTVVSIRLKRFVGGVWETNRLKEYRDGDWVKPNLKRYVSGVWVQVND